MGWLGIARSRPKMAAAWAAEKVGRLKLNGELTRYSPLSRLLELEGLAVGIEGKRALWLALEATADSGEPVEGFDFRALAERAESQRQRLETHRLAAASAALTETKRAFARPIACGYFPSSPTRRRFSPGCRGITRASIVAASTVAIVAIAAAVIAVALVI